MVDDGGDVWLLILLVPFVSRAVGRTVILTTTSCDSRLTLTGFPSLHTDARTDGRTHARARSKSYQLLTRDRRRGRGRGRRRELNGSVGRSVNGRCDNPSPNKANNREMSKLVSLSLIQFPRLFSSFLLRDSFSSRSSSAHNVVVYASNDDEMKIPSASR